MILTHLMNDHSYNQLIFNTLKNVYRSLSYRNKYDNSKINLTSVTPVLNFSIISQTGLQFYLKVTCTTVIYNRLKLLVIEKIGYFTNYYFFKTNCSVILRHRLGSKRKIK